MGNLNSPGVYRKIPSDFSAVQAVMEHQVGGRGVCLILRIWWTRVEELREKVKLARLWEN